MPGAFSRIDSAEKDGLRIRVALVGPGTEVRGGVSAVMEHYVRSETLARHVDWQWVPTSDGGGRPHNLWAAARAFWRFLQVVREIDIVHIHTSWVRSFWRKTPFAAVAILARKKVVLHFHTSHVDYLVAPVLGKLPRILVSRADAILVLSQRCAHPFLGLGFPVRILGNPVVRPRASEGPRCQAILYMGRVCAEKGIYDLIAAFRAVLDEFPQAELWIAGAGDNISAECGRAGIHHAVRHLGWLTGAAKEQAYLRASIFCLPSYDEAIPMSVLEAMAAELPTVTTDVGGLPDVVRAGVTGLMVKPGDIPALAAALAELLRHEASRAELGRAGKREAARYTPETVLSQLSALYQELCPR